MDHKAKCFKKDYWSLKEMANINAMKAIVNQVGGGSWSTNNFDMFMDYMREKRSLASGVTNGKYFVILYGPPASGKTKAREIACGLIRTEFGETAPIDQIEKSFINTDVDTLTYDRYLEDLSKTVLELLKDNYKAFLKTNNIKDENEININYSNLDTLVKDSAGIYFKYRYDQLSELMVFFALFLGKNVYFETASADHMGYTNNIASFATYYKYNTLLIYPYISNPKILFERSINRGKKEGRFLDCENDKWGLRVKIQQFIIYFNQIITANHDDPKDPKDPIHFKCIYPNLLIYKYDSNIIDEKKSYYNNLPPALYYFLKTTKRDDVTKQNITTIKEYPTDDNSKITDPNIVGSCK